MRKKLTVLALVLALGLGALGGYRVYSQYQRNLSLQRVGSDLLVSKGYKIVSFDGWLKPYRLTMSQLTEPIIRTFHSQFWMVNQFDRAYLNKQVETAKFTVTNHPLDTLSGNESRQTKITLCFIDGQLIGGTSGPGTFMVGAPDSIDGQTGEEVQGMSWGTWLKQWNELLSSLP